MGLDFIKKKSESLGKKSASSFLKVNKYENAQMALDLIAHICTASEDLDVSPCFEEYFKTVDEMGERLKEFTLSDEEFVERCRKIGEWMRSMLVNNASSTLKIAVAGGYSAGKSSLLNALTNIGNLLPTGIEPVSIVNTYLNCSPDKSKLIVRGENLKKDLVLLNEEVLACIQHASKSKVYIATVLEKLILDIPSRELFRGVTFVDTPGYNNSGNVNKENQRSDKDTAMGAFSDADVVFWCIDIDAGAITKNDFEMLEQVKDKPRVIFFTKMDKKPEDEIHKILERAAQDCLKQWDMKGMPVDIMGISCVGGEVKTCSYGNYSLDQLITTVREECGEQEPLAMCSYLLDGMFEEEKEASQNTRAKLEEDRQKNIKDKDEWHKLYLDIKETNKQVNNLVKDIILTNYDELMDIADKRMEALAQALDGWSDSLDRETAWSQKSGWFSDTSSLASAYQRDINKYNKLVQKNLDYNYYKREAREDTYKQFEEQNIRFEEDLKGQINSSENEYQGLLESIKQEEDCQKILSEYHPILRRALEEACHACEKMVNEHQERLQQLDREENNDIFSAISGDNYARFLSCFSQGVDLSLCNPEGYTPLTWAAKSGNNEMVKFFIQHEADLSQKDQRGYNALETAAICHYQDICELLIEADRSLIAASQPLEELAKKNTFTQWIAQY